MSSKLREALEDAEKTLSDSSRSLYGIPPHLHKLLARIRAALSEPLRNCDIGTAEEQTKRYRKFCSAHKYLASDFTYLCKGFGKGRCPFSSSHTKSQCEFAWSQMPYEEVRDANH